MKKSALFLLASVSLVGILNCALIEPAFAYQDKAVHSEASEDSGCCFVHGSSSHQWLPFESLAVTHDVKLLNRFIPNTVSSCPDSPIGSIFHPPLSR